MVDLQPIPTVVVLGAALIAAVTDLWKFKVYNALTLPLLVSGLLYHTVSPSGGGLSTSLIGMLCGFGVLVVFYLMGGYGGGDVKLMAAVGAWLGAELTFYVFIASSLVAGLYALSLVVLCGKLGETWTRCKIFWYRLATLGKHLGADDGAAVEANRIDRRRMVPFAAMMCLGVIATLIWLGLFRQP